jgi:DNA-binding transcriptional LysR family regulator
MNQLQVMQTFVDLAELGSFSAVARARGRAQSSISRELQMLEDHLGVTLCKRTTRKLSLTDDGEVYLRWCRQLLEEVRLADSSVGAGAHTPAGLLRVHAPSSLGHMLVVPHVTPLQHLYPELCLDIRLNDQPTDLLAEGFDLGITLELPQHASLKVHTLARCSTKLLASRRFVEHLAHLPSHPEELGELPCIVLISPSDMPGQWTMHHDSASTRTVRVTGPVMTDSAEMARACVLAGRGISLAPTWLFTASELRDELVQVLPEWRGEPREVYAVSPIMRHQHIKVRSVIDFLAHALKSS